MQYICFLNAQYCHFGFELFDLSNIYLLPLLYLHKACFYTLLLYSTSLKEIVHPKKMYSSSEHPGCKQACLFIGSVLEKFSVTSLAHQWILCSEWVPSEWEFKQLIKTSQQSTSKPHNSSPSINVLWSKNLVVCKKKKKKKIHKGILPLKYLSIIMLPPVKKSIPSCPFILKSNDICLELFWLVNVAGSVHISFLIQETTFSLEKPYYGDLYFSQ